MRVAATQRARQLQCKRTSKLKTSIDTKQYEFGTGLPNNRVKKFWESYVPSRQVRTDFSRFVLSDAETWVDADNDMSRTTYTNVSFTGENDLPASSGPLRGSNPTLLDDASV